MDARERCRAHSTEATTEEMLDAMHRHALGVYEEIRSIYKDEVTFVKLPVSVRDAVSRMEEHIGRLDNLACVAKEDVAGELAHIEHLERVWIEFQEYVCAGQAAISRIGLPRMDGVTNE